MRTAFIDGLQEIMEMRDDIVVITADMGFSVFEEIQRKYPKRFINTGVTEQSTIGVAAGIALSGYKVYVYAQAPFITMRCFEQVRLDIAYNKLNVTLVGAASGFYSNQLGVSHFSVEDIGLMRMLPGMTIFNPGDPQEAKWATYAALKIPGPSYIRLTKAGSSVVHEKKISIKIGEGILLREESKNAIFVSGSLLPVANECQDYLKKKGIHCALYSFPSVKPLNKDSLGKLLKKYTHIFTVEDHTVIGGFGSSIAEYGAEIQSAKVHRIGVQDIFTSVTGTVEYLLDRNGLSSQKIIESIEKVLRKT